MTVQTQTGTTAESFNWDELLPEKDAPAATYAVGTVNPLEVPEPLRKRVEVSLHASVTAIAEAAKKGNKPESVNPQWKLQSVSSADMGTTMVKLLRRYGSYRPEKDIPHFHQGDPVGQITIRAAVVRYGTKADVAADGKKDKEKQSGVRLAPEGIEPGIYVRYVAKPLESRTPKGKAK